MTSDYRRDRKAFWYGRCGIGFSEFDKELIVKTNNKLLIREIFSDESVRTAFQSLNNFKFRITDHNDGDRNFPLVQLKNRKWSYKSKGAKRNISWIFFSACFNRQGSGCLELRIT